MPKILIVDDSVDFAEFLAELLKREAYDPVIAHNGYQAIEYIDNNHFDAIITDVIMPEMDGIGLVKCLQERNITVPVIVISGGGITLKSDEALKVFEPHATAIFSKPLDYQKLLSTLSDLTKNNE